MGTNGWTGMTDDTEVSPAPVPAGGLGGDGWLIWVQNFFEELKARVPN